MTGAPPGQTLQGCLAHGIARLEGSGVAAPARDVRLMLEAVLGLEPGLLVARFRPLTQAEAARFDEMLARRAAREPMSHIRGWRAFWGRRFEVTAQVLDPRPETEVLVAAALEHRFSDVLDLGSGSGCILLTLLAERPEARGVGCEISAPAIAVARRNAQALGLAGRAGFVRSDWYERLRGRYDLIVSNPPYIAAAEMAGLAPELGHEPRRALTDEADGLAAYRAIAAGLPRHLAPGGRVMVEIGPRQAQAVSALLASAGLADIRVVPDFDGRDRVVAGCAGSAEMGG